MTDLQSLTAEELQQLVLESGEKPYRAAQIYHWLHVKKAFSYEEMTNIPTALKESLAERATILSPGIRKLQISELDGTRKYLFRFGKDDYVETVRMTYHHGHTVCISSQVGCRMGCRFCASTLNGLTRSLTAGEMLSQIYAVERDTGERVSRVVVMGMGEPLDNYDALVRFLRLITDEKGADLSVRGITVSTCGLVPGILKLAEEHLPVNLALSLHAPNDDLRRKIMPIAAKYGLNETIGAMKRFYEDGHRRLTFEYSLIRDVNDSDECAIELSQLLSGVNALVNLIPVNPVEETGCRTSRPGRVRAFKKKLENHGIHVTIRREMGRDIDGACGQLRKRTAEDG